MAELELYFAGTESLKVTPVLDPGKVNEAVRSYDLEKPAEGLEVIRSVLAGMAGHTVHTPHPMYYGLFNPRANYAGIMADFITAVYNPQLAAWSHSPYASEVESYLVEAFGSRFGYGKDEVDGVFASGGAEANFTAIQCAMNHTFPESGSGGIRELDKKPLLYCSAETHHSVLKSARMAGLGTSAVRLVPVDKQLRISTTHLEKMILEDRVSGHKPFMAVATAGTTGTGAIDPIRDMGEICRKYNLWYHVDAAYGGAAVLDSDLRQWLQGIENSDSLVVDLHKWFSVPMAASLFLTRDRHILKQSFNIQTEYMPGDARDLQITDPYTHSFQWSRRFIGLKIYLSLLMFGMEGYSRVIRDQVETGNYLRKILRQNQWEIMNETPLPVVCFTDMSRAGDDQFARAICDSALRSGKTWISVYPVHQFQTLRACITNYNTEKKHVRELVTLLGKFREQYHAE